MGVYDSEPQKYIIKLAEELEKIPEMKMPGWALFVKTSSARARPPADDKFWYKRAASMIRQIFLKGVVGVGRLRVKYGGRKKRGVKPEIFRKASGKMIRTILQQAEKAGLIEKAKGKKAGRQVSKKGKELLNRIQ